MGEARLAVMGVGNVLRGDDGAGIAVVRALKEIGMANAALIESAGDPAELLEWLAQADRAWLIDAVVSGAEAGYVHRIEAHAAPLPADFRKTSTHGFGPGEAIELARALSQLPPYVIVFGIEGRAFGQGAEMSEPVRGAVQDVARRIAREVSDA